MRVRIQFTVEVDPDAWCEHVGMDKCHRVITREVKSFAKGTVRETLSDIGVLIR